MDINHPASECDSVDDALEGLTEMRVCLLVSKWQELHLFRWHIPKIGISGVGLHVEGALNLVVGKHVRDLLCHGDGHDGIDVYAISAADLRSREPTGQRELSWTAGVSTFHRRVAGR